MPLKVADISFRAKLLREPRGLRFLGPTLRGAFGFALKDTVCQVSHGQCDRCRLRDCCAYPAVFDGRPPADRTIMRRSETIPQPFVLVVAEPDNWWGSRDELRWTVRLFGDAIMWSVYVVETFLRIGERGLGRHRIPYRIEQVTQGVNGQVLWDPAEDRVRKADPQPVSGPTSPREQSVLRWRCHTPLHLRVDGRRASRIDGLDLVLAGRRRWALLQEFYGQPATNGARAGGQARLDRRLSTAFIMARSFRTKMAIVRDGWECSWRGAGVCACMIPLGRSIGVAAGSGTDYSLPKQS